MARVSQGEETKRYRHFYRAARKHDRSTVVKLLREHPDLHASTGQAGTPLEILAQTAPDLLEPALEAGLSPDALSDPICQTLLQHAACEGDLDRIDLLLRYGADPEKRNHAGEVALGYACSWGQLEAAKRLVEAGADVNAVEEDPSTGYRNTPLDCAHRYPEIVEYLRGWGAKRLDELEGGDPPLARPHP